VAGLPNHTQRVVSERGYVYPELRIDPRVKFKVLFRAMPPESPIGPGAKLKLIDVETNLETPVTIPAGYTSGLIEWCFYSTGQLYLRVWLDGEYLGCFPITAGAETHEYEMITWADTKFKDPEGELDHTWDFEVENPTAADVVAFVHVALRVEKVAGGGGSSKVVRCPRCGVTFNVPPDRTSHSCPSCRHEFTTFLFGWWEGGRAASPGKT